MNKNKASSQKTNMNRMSSTSPHYGKKTMNILTVQDLLCTHLPSLPFPKLVNLLAQFIHKQLLHTSPSQGCPTKIRIC
jgi:hypothetical protein